LKGECGLHRVWCRCSHHLQPIGEGEGGRLVSPLCGFGAVLVNQMASAKSLGLGLSGEVSLLTAEQHLTFGGLAHMRSHLYPGSLHRLK